MYRKLIVSSMIGMWVVFGSRLAVAATPWENFQTAFEAVIHEAESAETTADGQAVANNVLSLPALRSPVTAVVLKVMKRDTDAYAAAIEVFAQNDLSHADEPDLRVLGGALTDMRSAPISGATGLGTGLSWNSASEALSQVSENTIGSISGDVDPRHLGSALSDLAKQGSLRQASKALAAALRDVDRAKEVLKSLSAPELGTILNANEMEIDDAAKLLTHTEPSKIRVAVSKLSSGKAQDIVKKGLRANFSEIVRALSPNHFDGLFQDFGSDARSELLRVVDTFTSVNDIPVLTEMLRTLPDVGDVVSRLSDAAAIRTFARAMSALSPRKLAEVLQDVSGGPFPDLVREISPRELARALSESLPDNVGRSALEAIKNDAQKLAHCAREVAPNQLGRYLQGASVEVTRGIVGNVPLQSVSTVVRSLRAEDVGRLGEALSPLTGNDAIQTIAVSMEGISNLSESAVSDFTSTFVQAADSASRLGQALAEPALRSIQTVGDALHAVQYDFLDEVVTGLAQAESRLIAAVEDLARRFPNRAGECFVAMDPRVLERVAAALSPSALGSALQGATDQVAQGVLASTEPARLPQLVPAITVAKLSGALSSTWQPFQFPQAARVLNALAEVAPEKLVDVLDAANSYAVQITAFQNQLLADDQLRAALAPVYKVIDNASVGKLDWERLTQANLPWAGFADKLLPWERIQITAVDWPSVAPRIDVVAELERLKGLGAATAARTKDTFADAKEQLTSALSEIDGGDLERAFRAQFGSQRFDQWLEDRFTSAGSYIATRAQAVEEGIRTGAGDLIRELKRTWLYQEIQNALSSVNHVVAYDVTTTLRASFGTAGWTYYMEAEALPGLLVEKKDVEKWLNGQSSLPSFDIGRAIASAARGTLLKADEQPYVVARDQFLRVNPQAYVSSERFGRWANGNRVVDGAIKIVTTAGATAPEIAEDAVTQICLEVEDVLTWLYLQARQHPEISTKEVIRALIVALLKCTGVDAGQHVLYQNGHYGFRMRWSKFGTVYTVQNVSFDVPLASGVIDDILEQFFDDWFEVREAKTFMARDWKFSDPHLMFVIELIDGNGNPVSGPSFTTAALEDLARHLRRLPSDELARARELSDILSSLSNDVSLPPEIRNLLNPEWADSYMKKVRDSKISGLLGKSVEDAAAAAKESVEKGTFPTIDLRGSGAAQAIRDRFSSLAMGNESETTLRRFDVDLNSLRLEFVLDIRHRHAWNLESALGNAWSKVKDEFSSFTLRQESKDWLEDQVVRGEATTRDATRAVDDFFASARSDTPQGRVLSQFLKKTPDLTVGTSLTGDPVVYVTGCYSTWPQAKLAAEALASQVGRPVLVIFNRSLLNHSPGPLGALPVFTSGGRSGSTAHPTFSDDLQKADSDRRWLTSLASAAAVITRDQAQTFAGLNGGSATYLQENEAVLELAYYLYREIRTKDVVVFSDSTGNAVVKNALATLGLLGLAGECQTRVQWVACGQTLARNELWPVPLSYVPLVATDDSAIDLQRRTGVGDDELKHFDRRDVRAYLSQIQRFTPRLMLSAAIAGDQEQKHKSQNPNRNSEEIPVQKPEAKPYQERTGNPEQKNPEQKNPEQKNPEQKNPEQKNPGQKNPDRKNGKETAKQRSKKRHGKREPLSVTRKSFLSRPPAFEDDGIFVYAHLTDYDGDGFDDLIVTREEYSEPRIGVPPQLLRRHVCVVRSGGKLRGDDFSVIALHDPFKGAEGFVLVGDFNGDRLSDVALVHESEDLTTDVRTAGSIEILQNDGVLGLDTTRITTDVSDVDLPSELQHPKYVLAGDVNADGCADIVRITDDGSKWAVQTLNPSGRVIVAGHGTLLSGDHPTVEGIRIGDADADGRHDLLVSFDRNERVLFTADATGFGFTNRGCAETDRGPRASYKLLFGDINGDLRADILEFDYGRDDDTCPCGRVDLKWRSRDCIEGDQSPIQPTGDSGEARFFLHFDTGEIT